MTDQRWSSDVVIRDYGQEGSVPVTECPVCWALVLEVRYAAHLATHEEAAP